MRLIHHIRNEGLILSECYPAIHEDNADVISKSIPSNTIALKS